MQHFGLLLKRLRLKTGYTCEQVDSIMEDMLGRPLNYPGLTQRLEDIQNEFTPDTDAIPLLAHIYNISEQALIIKSDRPPIKRVLDLIPYWQCETWNGEVFGIFEE